MAQEQVLIKWITHYGLGPIRIRIILATIIFYLAIWLSEHVGTVGGSQRSNCFLNPTPDHQQCAPTAVQPSLKKTVKSLAIK